MLKLTAKTRITIGLVCLSLSVLLLAVLLGLVPDRYAAEMQGRKELCESLAVTGSSMISKGELRDLEEILRVVAARNDKILSVGVSRIGDNSHLIAVGNHKEQWQTDAAGRSVETHVLVPLRNGATKWGHVEVRFKPVTQHGWMGFLTSPSAKMFAFILAASYLSFLFYLRKMLQHLDPSQAVPNRVRSALDTFAEGLLVIDGRNRIMLANPVFAGWIGVQPEKLVGRDASRLPWVSTDNDTLTPSFPWTDALRDEQPKSNRQLELAIPDGVVRKLKVNASPVMGQDGKYRGVLVSLDDVTQLENTKQQLSHAKDAAEAANQAKSDFLARMSHEIRTPMNAILGFTEVLRGGYDGTADERKEYLNTIHTSGQHLLSLINDILDLSKIEAGRMEIETLRCSPHQIIFDVIRVLQARAEQKGISLVYDIPDPLPETILSDSAKLRQILINLVGNAIKFTEEGGVSLHAKLADESDTAKLVIQVADTGCGMAPDAIHRVFEPFAQADSSITRRFGGTGLGLAISKRLAQTLGGKLDAESELGQGSVFTLVIDPGSLEAVQRIDTKAARRMEKRSQVEPTKVQGLPPIRVLVADDGESNRKLLSLVLGRAGAIVEGVENGEEAVGAYFNGEFDVILMDMHMPVMDGFTATRTLRERGCDIPIIALTADAMKGAEQKCRESGCSGFLTKPINTQRLIETLADLPVAEQLRAFEKGNSLDEHDHFTAEQAKLFAPTSLGPTCETPLTAKLEVRLDSEVARLNAAIEAEDFGSIAACSKNLNKLGNQHDLSDLATPAAVMSRLAEEQNMQLIQIILKDLTALASKLKSENEVATDVFSNEQEQSLSSRAPTNVVVQELAFESTIQESPRSTETSRVTGALQPLHSRSHAQSCPSDASESPIFSRLPADDPEYFEIIVEFTERLKEKLKVMQRVWDAGELSELASLAHWLKGAGGTAGFDEFTRPAGELEQLARAGAVNRITDQLKEICTLSSRIQVKGEQGSSATRLASQQSASTSDLPIDGPSTLESNLPMDDSEFREIVEEFVERLDEKLNEMQDALRHDDFRTLAELAHWVKGSGGTAGFDAFTAPARELECAARDSRRERSLTLVQQLQELRSRIVIHAS
jgi:PAS domain S-box-containing protein